MHTILRLSFLTAVLACLPAFAIAQQAAPQAITCSGPFAKDSSRAKLVEAFGAANITDETIDGAEGSTEQATVLFAKDPKRRVEVTWSDDKAKAKPASIIVKSPSAWAGPEGIQTGMTLPEVAQRNGEPFKINGFEWDYGGYAVNLKGKLASLPGGCGIMLRFSPGIDISGKTFRSIIGEKQIRSDNAILLSAKPTLAEWSLGYGD
ncbi:MAG: hypothetical protein J0H71_08005 [Rhizobiales bacterium]|nr:hypothetical protein [Hyphomicrobiales bacterium]